MKNMFITRITKKTVKRYKADHRVTLSGDVRENKSMRQHKIVSIAVAVLLIACSAAVFFLSVGHLLDNPRYNKSIMNTGGQRNA